MYANMLLHPVLLQVYNVTRFLEEHPGGDDVLLSATGTRYSEECHFDLSSNQSICLHGYLSICNDALILITTFLCWFFS
jgi:hypothetical protein